jgi:uncharacterized protein (TIGR00266 family)
MRYEIKYQPSYAMLVVHLSPGETITAEAGSMTYMNRFMEVHTHMRERGILGTLGLSLIGKQSFFVNDFTATGGEGEAGFVAAPVGDIQELEIAPSTGMIIQKASYIASTPGVELDIEWQGFTRGLFGQGIFMIKITGSGKLFINTFGAIDKHELGEGESLTVDNFHLVAFSDTCQYSVHKFGGLKETILGGEGLVTEIIGPGNVFIQTKNLREFTEWIWQLIEPQVRSKSR